ncbi:hypothetical protein T35B1_14125 [Salinisphaera shabanensis T35B1]|uniref:hypothetical protein n=1 Tax=Salinisphaera shabanensis TaxID=180542 RepID=UPI00333ED016
MRKRTRADDFGFAEPNGLYYFAHTAAAIIACMAAALLTGCVSGLKHPESQPTFAIDLSCAEPPPGADSDVARLFDYADANEAYSYKPRSRYARIANATPARGF